MNVLLLQLDGKIPNLALMRIAKHHREAGDDVQLRHGAQFESGLFDQEPDKVYASAIFRKSIPLAERVKKRYPQAVIGGTGVDPARKGEVVSLSPVIAPTVTAIESHGFPVGERAVDLDYSLYPRYSASLGFTQRGCRLACSFCVVGDKEGPMRESNTIADVWRGEGHPKHLHLLDNDFFGQPRWREQAEAIREGKFKVSFNQGINARFLTDEAAESIASMDYRDDSMTTKRIYTAWDNLKDEERLFAGLGRLVKYGVKPDYIMVYMLCGYWPNETQDDREYRRKRLREFGARPYPMPFVRTAELTGFQRWVVGAYDKRVAWADWVANNYRPEGIGEQEMEGDLFE
jgi:hypothetical protein